MPYLTLDEINTNPIYQPPAAWLTTYESSIPRTLEFWESNDRAEFLHANPDLNNIVPKKRERQFIINEKYHRNKLFVSGDSVALQDIWDNYLPDGTQTDDYKIYKNAWSRKANGKWRVRKIRVTQRGEVADVVNI